ncbi:TRM11 family SAM-dependent methyltransferase [Clostridium tarantellae]|uniref:SAM-dependent methyltransferase n=1 Tax=Clostridium tarantellae TaxID=39493 RepID=A0A6I1MNK1_9CLOT|nr:SAM-dependent methyltransferase [Clostridium tarantellae]MPQ43842.1 SAM-dependent methyltransferase [Clostridium tarantellae]
MIENLNKHKLKEYFYVINYPHYEKELCEMEIKYIFNSVLNKKYFFSNKEINPSRSAFIKHSISIIYSANSLKEITDKILEDKLSYDNFKVCYVKSEDGDVEYNERLNSLKEIGFVINGFPDIHNPSVILGVTKVKDRWIFGEYNKNDFKWHNHDNKPYSYSNSLGVKTSKAVVNIAVGNDLKCSVVDPCCGVGTVVIEALDLGINIKGYEINESIAYNAKKNLEFLGFKDVVKHKDMHTIEEFFDVAIVDLPYGLFTPTTIIEQREILKTARKISKKMILITSEDMEKHITSLGFKIIDKCIVYKNNFKRRITVCI